MASCGVAVVGAGIVGVATAHYLKALAPDKDVVLIDASQPMAHTSAVSGENYRNWWPHPIMTAFTDHSITLLESLVRDAGKRVHLTRRGYALATRTQTPDQLLAELTAGYGDAADIRVHERADGAGYHGFDSADWQSAPQGVDLLTSAAHIRKCFPSFDDQVTAVVHVRRAGAFDSYQLGQYLLEQFRAAGGRRVLGRLTGVDRPADGRFLCHLDCEPKTLACEQLVSAAGPWLGELAAMLDLALPVFNVAQQKIAFADTRQLIPRDMPFAIDLDAGPIPWSDAERAALLEESSSAPFAGVMPGATHCRPDGGDTGSMLKLGWAYNNTPSKLPENIELDPAFVDLVLRGATRLHPALRAYVDIAPPQVHHYGGHYTMTEENWPLIGPTDIDGLFVVGAMSGFGTMAACAGGELCAQHVLGAELPSWAHALSMARYTDNAMMNGILTLSSRGIL